MVQKIKKEDEEMLKSIKNELARHEKDVKNKIREYADTMKKILRGQVKRLPLLIGDIKSLVGSKESKGKGKLSKMIKKIVTFRDIHHNEIDYLEIVHIPEISQIHKVGELRPWSDDKREIKQIESTLNQILDRLEPYLKGINDIHTELSGQRDLDMETYKAKIKQHEDCMGQFGAISLQNDIYLGNIESASSGFFKRAELKKRVEAQGGRFKENFIDDVNIATSVTYEDLRHIHQRIKKEHELVGIIRARFNNAKFLLEYFDVFAKHKKILDEIKLNEKGLSGINELIQSMVKFRDEYQTATSSIIGSSIKLFTKFEKRPYNSGFRIGTRHRYLPKRMSLDAKPLVELEDHIKKLKAIKSVSPTASWYSIGSLHLIEELERTDIDGLLKELKGIDDTLKCSGYIEYNIGKLRESYEENKNKIDGGVTQNGNSIEQMFKEINKIPGKIAELQSELRYNIVLLKIAKSVNEILKKVGENTGKLERKGGIIKGINRYIRSKKDIYQYISETIGHLEFFMCSIRLASIKGIVVFLEQIVLKK